MAGSWRRSCRLAAGCRARQARSASSSSRTRAARLGAAGAWPCAGWHWTWLRNLNSKGPEMHQVLIQG